MSVENINGTPRNHAKALSMWVRPRAYTNGTPYKEEKDINVSTTVCVHNGTLYKQDKETSMWVRERTLLEDTTETITWSTVVRDKAVVPMSIITALGDRSRTTDSSRSSDLG